MVDTKKEISVKSVIGILAGTFSFLFTSIMNGMPTMNAIIISTVIAIAGFLFAWFGVQQISIIQLTKILADILTVVVDKTKDNQTKMLEIELIIKKDLELLNSSWVALNEQGQSAIQSAKEVVTTATKLPGPLGEIAKTAKEALDALKPASEPPK